ncbi:MAG: S1C family serine protease [Nocardioides sp.]
MNDTPPVPPAGDDRPDDTSRYDHPVFPFGGSPTPPPAGTVTERRPRRTAFAATVVATSLLVGGAAGVAGAAAWGEWHPAGSDTASSTSATTAQVVDTPTTQGDESVQTVASQVLPSVVKIDVSGAQEAGSGSGIILSSDGQILTNNHVVAIAGGSGSIRVSFNDGTSAKAKVLGTDPLTDTAVIQAEGVNGLTPATIGKSGDLAVGQGVVAIGSPFGLESTVTSGIVSALDRPVDVGTVSQGNSTVYPAIQTDAAINPGNSGGPLVDLHGHVVGINSSIQTSTSDQATGGQAGSIGLGFAIPIDEVLPIVQEMSKGEAPTHARLGISVSDLTAKNATDATQGAQVQDVTNGSTADNAGIRSGDVITKVDDHLITGSDSLVATIRSYRPGDKVTVTYERGGSTKTVTLTLDSDASATNS